MVIGNVLFKIIGKLGRGSFGTVFKVQLEGSNKEYALKIIKNPASEGIKSLRELDIMTRLLHPNITKAEMIVADYYISKKKQEERSRVGILMEIAKKDLYKAVGDLDFSVHQRLESMKQLSLGIKFLHESNYLHLDIKPLNVLLFQKNITKITDFGLSLHTDQNNKAAFPIKLITITHRSPQILKGERVYTAADDIWSLGITFLDALSSKSLFTGFQDEHYTDNIVYQHLLIKLAPKVIQKTLSSFLNKLPKNIKTNAISIISKMLSFEAKDRPTIFEVLSSPLFYNFAPLKVEGVRLNPPVPKPLSTDILNYEGFDVLMRISTRIPISLETFFLAVDIYQRSLAFSKRFGNEHLDYSSIVLQASIALYMAIKMLENFFADTEKITEIAGNLFNPKDLIIGEAILINNLGGIVYPNNLFTASSTKTRLIEAFEISRDCRIYRLLDLEEWKKLNDAEEIMEGKYDKYISFNSFLILTPYYSYFTDTTLSYIPKLYQKDSLRMFN